MFFGRTDKFFKDRPVLDRLVLPPFEIQRASGTDIRAFGDSFQFGKLCKTFKTVVAGTFRNKGFIVKPDVPAVGEKFEAAFKSAFEIGSPEESFGVSKDVEGANSAPDRFAVGVNKGGNSGTGDGSVDHEAQIFEIGSGKLHCGVSAGKGPGVNGEVFIHEFVALSREGDVFPADAGVGLFIKFMPEGSGKAQRGVIRKTVAGNTGNAGGKILQRCRGKTGLRQQGCRVGLLKGPFAFFKEIEFKIRFFPGKSFFRNDDAVDSGTPGVGLGIQFLNQMLGEKDLVTDHLSAIGSEIFFLQRQRGRPVHPGRDCPEFQKLRQFKYRCWRRCCKLLAVPQKLQDKSAGVVFEKVVLFPKPIGGEKGDTCYSATQYGSCCQKKH